MDVAEWLHKNFWRELFPKPVRRKETNEWEQMSKRLQQAANSADRVEKARKILEEAIEKNGNGLPF